MSICSTTLRALSRSRVQTSKTLLPFLYQTYTIQQWKPAARPIARRPFTSRSKNNESDDIPFEDDSLPPAIDAIEPARKTTITGSERAAFEKLYKTFNTQGKAKSDNEHIVELDQIADEYYEDDEEHPPPSLDKVFDQVLKGEPRWRGSRSANQRTQVKSKKSEEVQAAANSPLSPRTSKTQSRRKDAKAEAARIKELKLAERERVDKLLQTAQTDRELWKILEREVFEQVRKLDLDGTKKGKDQQSTKPNTTNRKLKSDPTASDPRILFQNYQHHLITALLSLRTAFPSSTLPLSLLPTIKSLGRSSYALGATTTLYKHLLRTAWLQQSSYTQIDQLLIDMDNGAIEFDDSILDVLDAVIKEHDMARSGRLGREMQMVYSMDQFLEGIRKVKQWRGVIAERLGVASEERRVQQRPVREVDQGRREAVAEQLVRPRDTNNAAENGFEKSNQEHIPLVEEALETQTIPQVPASEPVDIQGKTDTALLLEETSLHDMPKQSTSTANSEQDNNQSHEHQETQTEAKDITEPTDPTKVLL